MAFEDARERFEAKFIPEPNSGCWLWTAAIARNGYGQFNDGIRTRIAHRVAYEINVGPIPTGLELDHKCRVRSCVNPAHLEPVSHAVNMARAPADGFFLGGAVNGARQRAKTHCPQGHEYAGKNLHVDKHGHRSCRTCLNASKRRRSAQRRAANGRV